MTGAELHIRIALPNGRIGPGKVALLEAIGREGSISAAARSLGMSYRRAWGLVDQLNALMGTPMVATSPGGAGGGGAVLTAAGQALAEQYRAIEAEARAAVTGRLEALLATRTGP
ncbi:winged helix-turn-helix domain-containing protein [Falsiroseomonas sp. CW058]|uniref:winged helix-turn-helix domain-containing protein n=1 Tax=Falsiroseomonas sp. CW058 TaxID=3388664 RepID=UPI003D32088A